MTLLENIDLGSALLSFALAAGFIAFILLILRVAIISISSLIMRIRDSSPNATISEEKTKGFDKK
tara:strand:- start:1608 stop:1802 length:195 start_codon:yes stop_codon:yes gene_type:complete